MSDIARAFARDVWTVDGQPISMMGIPFTTRMTVVRLNSGALWLHSPVNLEPAIVEAVAKLGEVAHLVAPNKFHHVYLQGWQRRFPQALVWAGPGLRKRRRDIVFTGDLADESPEDWASDLDQVIFGGTRVLPEAIFFHRASRTLIVTDLIQAHEPALESWFWRVVKRLDGVLAPKGGVPLDLRLTVRDKAAARAARDRILAWDFDRLVIAHGRCIERDARDFVARAFRWLG